MRCVDSRRPASSCLWGGTHRRFSRIGIDVCLPVQSSSVHLCAHSLVVEQRTLSGTAQGMWADCPSCSDSLVFFSVAQIEAGLQRRLTLVLALLSEGVTCDPNARVVDERLPSPDSETAPVEKRATVMFVYHRGFRILSTLLRQFATLAPASFCTSFFCLLVLIQPSRYGTGRGALPWRRHQHHRTSHGGVFRLVQTNE